MGWPAIAILLLALLGWIYLTASYAVSCWLTRPARQRCTETPSAHGLPWESVHCRTSDGLSLAGWVISSPQARGTVLLHHGLGGSRAQTLSRAIFLARAGYRCVAFDHRAHGRSEGTSTTFGFHKARDVAAARAVVRGRWPGEPCAVFGLSMGAAAICFSAEQVRDVQAVILEGVYHDITGAFTGRLATMYPVWFRPLVHGIIRITERRLGVRMGQVVPANYIGRFEAAPILLVTGTLDDHAGPNEARRLQGRCTGPNELWVVPGARHGDVFEVAGKEYEERILAFLDKHLTTMQ